MFHDESWKPIYFEFIYFEVKISKVKVTTHESQKQYWRGWVFALL